MTKSLEYWSKLCEKSRKQGPLPMAHEASGCNRTPAEDAMFLFFTYSTQSFNTYGKLIKSKYFNDWGYGFSETMPRLLREETPEAVVNAIAEILKGKPVYKNGDLHRILQVLKKSYPTINIEEQFKITERPSLLSRFSSFFCCYRPKVAVREND